jgi:cytochrome P450
MLTYLVYDKDLLECVRAETAPAFKGERTDLDHIWNHSPLLRGVWDETLRVTAFSSSVRFVAEDTVIGGKLLRKDRRIMMPYRQMHLNEAVFGERTGEFDAERFVRNPKLRRYNMAFGGGSSKCPGRHFSGQATMVFVAMMLHRFEISLDPADQKFPEAEESRPVLGLISVKKSSGLDLKLTRRTPEKM